MAPEFENLEITENIFKNVKFFISGVVQEKIVDLLKCGGAERLNYFSDYVTHLIVGETPEENDIVDANDVYEIPALTPKWILMCVALKHLVSTKPYLYTPSEKLFSNLTFCFSNIREDRNYLWSLITYNGGVVQLNLNKHCNYLVTTRTEGKKYEKAENLGSEVIKIVTPDWILETVRNKSYADFTLFHPKLINWPKPVKHESTTAITGFEPEQSDVVEPSEEKTVSDSTQALLDKLKQRMPWNQPSVPSKTETVAPPNVIAPSFIQKRLGQGRLQQQLPTSQPVLQLPSSTSTISQVQCTAESSVINQLPRSIVHHTPNSPSQQEHLLQSQQAYNPLNINRLLSQSQPQSNLQHLRGQLAPAQLHQHLLQQRIQQQNIIQQNPSGQIPLQQQLLQQQLSRNQISEPLLQNQGPLLQQTVTGHQQKIQGNLTLNQVGQQHLNQLQHQLQLKQQNQQQSIPVSQQQILNQVHQQTNQMNQPPKQTQQITQNQQQLQIGQSPVHLHQNQQQMRMNQNQQQIPSNQNQQLQQLQLNPNQQIQLNKNQQQIQLNQTSQQIQLNQTSQQIQLNQTTEQTQQINQQQIHVNSNQQVTQSQQVNHNQQHLNQNQQQVHLSQNQQQLQLNQNTQQIQLTQNQQQLQQQLQLNQNHQKLQGNQLHLTQNQQQQVQLNQNQQLQLNQQQLQLNQNQQQLQLKQNQQQLQINQSQHQLQLNQNQQQIQLNQSQQDIQLNQNQVQLNQNPQQQIPLAQSQQIQINQNQQVINQQLLQNTTTNQMTQHQLNQQQIQLGQGQNIIQQNINQHILTKHNQQLLQQKQQFINQQQGATNQQTLQNSPNLIQQQQQFISSNFNQNVAQEQQQIIGQQQSINQQMNVQTLNQQLSTQNLGQQLNQQKLSQHLNQQPQLNQQINHSQIQNQPITQEQIGQQLSQNQLNTQQLNIQLQQQQLNRQQQLQVQQQNQQNLQQHQLNQITQQGTATQQVVRTQFQQQPTKIGQILVNQGTPQTAQPQRAQIGQPLWPQQPSQVTGAQSVRQPINLVHQLPRVQWSPNSQQGTAVPQRQYIQLDARTHNELQKMSPEQQAQFVAKLQRHRQLQQRGGHILIRGNVPPGLTAQQQVQWLQQQAKQQGIVLPPNIQQNITAGTLTQTVQHGGAPGLSPINQNVSQFSDQNQQQQLHLRQYRLHQLQLQREQAQKNHLAQQQQGAAPQPAVVRPIGQPPLADSTTNPPQTQDGNIQHSLVVNAKTKTALANMLSIKLQSGSSSVGVQRPETIPEPSAAGTLRLMTAQHNAALISKPQEIIALQRRTINGPNGELIRPPGPPQPPVTSANELKMPFTTKSSLPQQHRPGPFYGHNPNLKLPPDLFLLGCIFVVVEIENVLEEEIPGWQQKIEKYGGEVEKQYCSRVTHVLCETQRHGVVMQALRDCKRCVTIVWLSDVIQRKQVLPPWTALHLPNIYLDTSPASKHLISITGFEGVDRERVKQMIRYTGAKCTSYLSKHNTLLISAKANGRKCSYAKKWQIPIVNVQWLTDILLGHFTGLNQMDHQLYQQYPTPPNFSFDPKLVPNLMVAWKAPINISQESYERVKRSASPVVIPKKTKKLKTEKTDENDNISEDQPSNTTYKILFSMIANIKEMQSIVNGLGGAIAKDCQDFTHLVMHHLARSNKLFFAISKGVHIISDKWLKDSQECGQFLPEINYSLNPKEFNYEYKCDIEQTLQTKNRDKLFEGKSFYVTPSVFPSRRIIVELITCSGGVVEKIRRSAAQIEATNTNSPYSYIIITHENDLHLVADLLKNKKDKVKMICNAELIFSAILRQTFEVDPYSVCVL